MHVQIFLFRLIFMAMVIVGIAQIIPGIELASFASALVFACVLTLLNTTIRPLLLILTLPVTLATVGVFALIVNGLTFWMAAELSFGVQITSFWGAFWGGAISWIASSFLSAIHSHTRKKSPPPSEEEDEYSGCTIDIDTDSQKR